MDKAIHRLLKSKIRSTVISIDKSRNNNYVGYAHFLLKRCITNIKWHQICINNKSNLKAINNRRKHHRLSMFDIHRNLTF